MKFYVAIMFLFLAYNFSTTNITAKNEINTAEKLLTKVSAKLSKLKTISYTLEHENNAVSIGFYKKRRVESFLDFTSPDKFIGVRYQLDEPDYIYIFNGTDYFFLHKKSKTYSVKQNPNSHDFENAPGLSESLLKLRNSLPKIISDETIKKSFSEQTINNKKVYVTELVMDSKVMRFMGDDFSTTSEIKFTYRLTIDKTTLLPLEIFRINNANSNTEKSNFEYKPAKLPAPTETSWFYSSYSNEYKPAQPLVDRKLEAGQIAPDWKLPALKDDAFVSLSQYKGRVVLLEFWISFCGFCIKAVPALNQIEDKYKDKDFKLLAINDYDAKDIILKFENINKPKYRIVYGGRETTEKYGVIGYPTVFLIDKTGKIIYSGDGVDGKLLDELVGKSLER